MSQPTTRLLKYSPEDAVLLMVNNQYNLHLRPEYTRIGPPTDWGQGVTEVLIESFDSGNEAIPCPYRGSFRYRYERLDVGTTLGVLRFDAPIGVSSKELVSRLSEDTGLVISDTDFVDEIIESTPYTLVANPLSLRWVGSTTVLLGEVV